jgi:hypothetical protein
MLGVLMKVYIACTVTRQKDYQIIKEEVLKKGWEITHDWTQDFPTSGRELKTPQLARDARRDLQGVLDADVMIVLLPAARGTHIEIGAALAANRLRTKKIDIFLIEDEDQNPTMYSREAMSACPFYWLDDCKRRTSSLEDVVSIITEHFAWNDLFGAVHD